MIYANVLEALGNTPMIRLARMVPEDCAQVLVKYEGVNIGGSIKTRTAYNMILDAEARGILKPGSVIIEPTSGNTGIGLCSVAAARGYKCIIVMPDSMSMERRLLMSAFGGELVLTPGKEGMTAAIAQACVGLALVKLLKINPQFREGGSIFLIQTEVAQVGLQ